MPWTQQELKTADIAPHLQLEIWGDTWVDLSMVEKRYQSNATLEGEDLMAVETKAFDIEIELNQQSNDSVSGEWYYCPKSSDVPFPNQADSQPTAEKLAELDEQLSSIRDPAF